MGSSNYRYWQRRELIDALKLARGCAECGFNQHPAALDFDHRPGTMKEFSIAGGLSYSWARIVAEMAKCDIVCANCHRVRTHIRQQYKPKKRK